MPSFALRALAASLVALFVGSCGSGGGTTSNGSTTPASCPTDDSGTDALYSAQWHLKNLITGFSGQDINVESAWTTRKGTNVRIAVVDDGLEIAHEDLCQNVVAGASYNYLNGTTDPTPTYAWDNHGTSVSGIAAARDLNNRGVRGVAPRARLVGYNVLTNPTNTNIADAMVRGKESNGVSSNSWGAPDGYGTLDAPSSTWRAAIDTGLTTGRNGKGTVYVWAAGNGRLVGSTVVDNSNYDGQANYRGVIAVGAVTHRGTKATYSEPGANLWVSAPAGEFCGSPNPALTTVDRSGDAGYNATNAVAEVTNTNYTQCFNGTSGATPVVSGVVALMLEANPNLTWRDVRLILAQSARQNDVSNGNWLTAEAPYNHFSHNYGFGVVDAQAAVALAPTWPPIGPEVTATDSQVLNAQIDDFATINGAITIATSGINDIEFIEITINSTHTFSGNLDIQLTSPAGRVSYLSETHNCTGCRTTAGSLWSWTFGSARHLGEAADGIWTLRVYDGATGDTGQLVSWSLKFYGH